VHPARRAELPHSRIDDRISSAAFAPGLEALRIVVPDEGIVLPPVALAQHTRVLLQDGGIELAPYQLIEPFFDTLLQRGFDVGRLLSALEALTHRDRAEAEVWRESRRSIAVGSVAILVIAPGCGFQEAVEAPLGCRLPAGGNIAPAGLETDFSRVGDPAGRETWDGRR
jgi:hypothetical protein